MGHFTALLAVILTGMFGAYWGNASREDITIKAPGFEQSIKECLGDGLEARIRFDIRLCRHYGVWFDGCAQERAEHHTISFDEITESYRVVSDRFGDESSPVAVGIPSKQEAISTTLTVEGVTVSFLARGNAKLSADPRAYIQVRGTFSCKGSVNRTLARLSQIFTLGMVNTMETTSDWYDFDVSSGVVNLPD